MLEIKEINCPVCGKRHEAHLVECTEDAMYRGIPVKYTSLSYECPFIGTLFDDEETMQLNFNRLVKAYQEKIKENEVVYDNNQYPYMTLISEESFSEDMITLSEEEFKEHMEDSNFFEVYGNPVKVVSSSGTIYAVSYETYKRYAIATGRGDEIEKVEAKIKADNDDKSSVKNAEQ